MKTLEQRRKCINSLELVSYRTLHVYIKSSKFVSLSPVYSTDGLLIVNGACTYISMEMYRLNESEGGD